MSKQPVLFLAHGDPMNAIADNAFTRRLEALGGELERPSAVAVVSAHWLTEGTSVGASEHPETIHDFGGFPEELYLQRYPAPGDAALAHEISSLLPGSTLDPDRGLDHGAWAVLKFLFPKADVPVVPVSVDIDSSPRGLMEKGRALRTLRDRGVLIVGSGNLVHNIGMYFATRDDAPYPWATAFDAYIADALRSGDVDAIEHWGRAGAIARYAHPSEDHLLPLFTCLGAVEEGEQPSFPHAQVIRSMSMRCVRWG